MSNKLLCHCSPQLDRGEKREQKEVWHKDREKPLSRYSHGLPTESQLPMDIPPLQHGVLQGLRVDFSLPMDPHGLQEHSCLSTGCEGTSALVHRTPPAIPPSPPRCFSYTFSFLSSAAVGHFFPPFLNALSQRCQQHHWWAWPCPAMSLSWSWLALGMGKVSGASQRGHPAAPPSLPESGCAKPTHDQMTGILP